MMRTPVRRLRVVALALVAAIMALAAQVGLPAQPDAVSFAAAGDPASMPTARAYPGVVTAADGKVYAIGGQNGEHYGIHVNTVEAYDAVSNTWMPRTSMPTARYIFATAAATNGKIYAVGGTDLGAIGLSTIVEEYDPVANTWETRASLPVALQAPAAAAASNGNVYVFGGYCDPASSSGCVGYVSRDVFEYDPVGDAWTARASMPSARAALQVVAASNGKLYAIGGAPPAGGSSNHLTTVEEYDPVADTWTPRASMQTGRSYFGAAAASNGKIYVIGGATGAWPPAGYLKSVEEYDPATNTWTGKSAMPTGRNGLGVAAAADGKLYAIGGAIHQPPGGTLATVESYNPATNAWLPDPNPPVVQSVVVNGGAAATNLLAATLTLQASDPDGPVAEMSFSNDGTNWSSWEPFATSKAWTLTAGADGVRTVHARVRDPAGSVSQTASDTILYETTAPTIASFTINGGAITTTSTTVNLMLAASDPAGGSGVSQMAFSNNSGTTWSPWEAFAVTKSWPLPSGDGPKVVLARVRDGAGNASAPAVDSVTLDTTVGTSFGVSINQAAIWTNSVDVTLTIPAAPGTAQMKVSNDGGFIGVPWEPYASTKQHWILDRFEGSPVTMIVYVRFGDAGGSELPNSRSSDNIVLDIEPPSGSVAIPGVGAASSHHTDSPIQTVQLAAADTQSGAAMTMRLSNRPDFAGAIWKPFAGAVSWDFTGGLTVYAQFKDGAGNLSPVYSTSLPGVPASGTSPAPGCSPRPRIVVHTERAVGIPEIGGALIVTVSTTGNPNGLRAARFDSFTNAIVDVGSQQNQTAPFAVSIPPGQEPTSLQFTIRRQAAGQFTTVRLVLFDGCGEWSTFVGGGPNAF